ncbi:MAG: V-type ATP synthase subunit K [Candidatus Aenigmarchaeota archaeon]|nr:V-type ATP synthase subunit K [Candidatus Aenigmarchaeota archaeon]
MASELVPLAAAAAIGMGALATAWAEKEIGSAAIGAMAEKQELFSKGLILTVIPETIIIFALVVALQIVGLAAA